MACFCYAGKVVVWLDPRSLDWGFSADLSSHLHQMELETDLKRKLLIGCFKDKIVRANLQGVVQIASIAKRK